jgi:hypothetical protein
LKDGRVDGARVEEKDDTDPDDGRILIEPNGQEPGNDGAQKNRELCNEEQGLKKSIEKTEAELKNAEGLKATSQLQRRRISRSRKEKER